MKKHGDTTFQFFCYDKRDTLIASVADFDSVYYYSLYKSYTDPLHTYKDNDGQQKPLPVATIIKRYDRLGKEKWMSVSYPGNQYEEVRVRKNDIVACDTVVTYEPVKGVTGLMVYSYYRVKK